MYYLKKIQLNIVKIHINAVYGEELEIKLQICQLFVIQE